MQESAHFQHIMLYYFHKDKKATEMQKKILQYMKKLLWLIECIKSGLWSFLLEISLWMMFQGSVDQLNLIVIK